MIAESTLDRLISCSHIITLTRKSYRTLLRPDKALAKEVVTVQYYTQQCTQGGQLT